MAELVPFISKLDLSRNKVSGKIRKSFSNCSYLNVLRLDHNQLTGEIPPELGLLNCIKVFSVSDNSLSVVSIFFVNASITLAIIKVIAIFVSQLCVFYDWEAKENEDGIVQGEEYKERR